MADIEKITELISKGKVDLEEAVFVINAYLKATNQEFDISKIVKYPELLSRATNTSINYFRPEIEAKMHEGELLHKVYNRNQLIMEYYYGKSI